MGKRVLIADDNAFIRTLVKAALSTVGYEVFEATDGDEALASILSDTPDMVLLDLVMPNLSGFDVLQQLTRDGTEPPCPIMMLTTAATDADLARAKEIGAADYLVKPFDKNELREKVAALLGE